MNYEFPVIETIADVLPHIEGRDEFVVAEREGYTVINYVVAMEDTFPPIRVAGGSAKMRAERALTNAMRRECRGLIFGPDGRIMSRPFHKFFNINEREETQVNRIDMSQPHVIMEKMDGSMIRPIIVDGVLRLATKMGVTEVALEAEKVIDAMKNPAGIRDFLYGLVKDGVTPLFEFVSPDNRIVIDYSKAELVLLALRHNITGEYMRIAGAKGDRLRALFREVPQYGSVEGNLDKYIARQRQAEGREGDIIRFADGHMLKIKNDWYVRIHKTLDRVRFDRNIVDLIISESLDDALPMLPEVEADRIRDFEARFWTAFKQKENRLYGLRIAASQSYEDDRKRIALEFVPTLDNKADAQFIFRMLDGNDLRELMLEHVRKNITTNVKWDACAEWLGM